MSKAKNKKATLEVAVAFGGVSIGNTTARLGVKIQRDFLNVVAADEIFTGKRLAVIVQLGAADADQRKLFDVELEVAGSVDVKRIGVSPETITAGLTFNLKTLDIATLARFSLGVGRLKVFDVQTIPADDAPADEHDEKAEE